MLFRMIFHSIRAKTFRTRKNFPGSNATLLPEFLGLWLPLGCSEPGMVNFGWSETGWVNFGWSCARKVKLEGWKQ